MDRSGPVAQLRRALCAFAEAHEVAEPRWCVALSGGPDSLALTAVAAADRPTTALIVDHGLQGGSSEVAEAAREQALTLGCEQARVLTVQVGSEGGPEAAARDARYQALLGARDGAPVLLGHTLDDQAETVLLGLGRGSGARSLAGMRPYQPPWCRPLLAVRRSVTHAACAQLGVTPWHDPHNREPRFTRSRVRDQVMPVLEDVLGRGVAEALARTAAALGEDCDVLDDLAEAELAAAVAEGGLHTARLRQLPAAVRRRGFRGGRRAGGATKFYEQQNPGVETQV
jgi:tRNA(Ile)-lysidine synthase